MKILHSKSTAEPILLVSACHNMNLVAVVTASAAAVYRATTLTVVASLPLKHEVALTSCEAEASRVQGCWSPSGRIFALALPTGVILLLDVEEGVLVRRLVPRDTHEKQKGEAALSSSGGGASIKASNEEEISAAAATAVEADDDENEEARKISCEEAINAAPSLPISLPAAPILCMTWSTVEGNVVVPHGSGSPCPPPPLSDSVCLPLHAGISQSLLREMESGDPQSQQRPPSSNSNNSSLPVTFLTLVGAQGAVSIVAGGLHEVLAGRLAAEGEGLLAGAVDLLLITSAGGDLLGDTHILSQDGASLSSLSARGLLALAQKVKKGESALPIPQHFGYMLIRGAAATASHQQQQQQQQQQRLAVIDFRSVFTTLATRPSIPVLCRVAEYCRSAWCCLEAAHRQWDLLLRGRTRRHLRLPECAKLLRDAVVEAVALPDERELKQYYASLDRNALADDLDRMSLVLSVLANDVYSICYRAYDLSLSLVAELSKASLLTAATGTDTCTFERLCELLAAHRRYCESFLLSLRTEADEEANIICFALQRASLLFDFPGGGAAGELDEAGNPITEIPFSYGTEPLPTARHPALLASLERILQAQDASGAPSAAQVALHQWHDEMSVLLRGGLAVFAEDECLLPCHSIPLGNAGCWRMDLEPVFPDVADESRKDSHEGLGSSSKLLVYAVEGPSLASSDLRLATSPGEVRRASVAAVPAFTAIPFGADPVIQAALPTPRPTPAWYSRLGEDQHLLLLLADTADGTSDGFTLVAVDDGGNVNVKEADEDEDELAEEDEEPAGPAEDEERGNRQEATDDAVVVATGSASCAGYAMLEVKGMEVSATTLMASVSRGRQFSVVAARDRFVVIDLFEE